MDFEKLARLRRYLKVKHHIPGRIRIVFSPGILLDRNALDLARSHEGLPPGIRSTRLNSAARSVVIEYDRDLVDPALLEELAVTRDDARAAGIVEYFHNVLNMDATKEES